MSVMPFPAGPVAFALASCDAWAEKLKRIQPIGPQGNDLAVKTDTLAKLFIAYSGLAWGLFWLPLHALDRAGVHGLWAVAMLNGLPAVFTLAVLAWRSSLFRTSSAMNWAGFMSALSMLLYSISVIETEVVRAMLLFYLSPVWSMFLARIFLGERMTASRWFAIALALGGMAVVFRAEHGLPLPRSAGDWIALTAGAGWAYATLLLRKVEREDPNDIFIHFFLWMGLLIPPLLWFFARDSAPPLATVTGQLWWITPVTVGLVMTAVYPAITGILYMTEISAGAVSAALWSGEPFGPREATGVVLITLAGAFESLVELVAARVKRA
jgi:drug/metabolite transporter (DMT)-like permease